VVGAVAALSLGACVAPPATVATSPASPTANGRVAGFVYARSGSLVPHDQPPATVATTTTTTSDTGFTYFIHNGPDGYWAYWPVAATVIATPADGAARTYSVHTAGDGSFALALPPGAYQVVAKSHPSDEGRPQPVTITAGRTTHVEIYFDFP